MTTRIGVAIMSAALLLYIVLVGQRAVLFIATGEPIAIALGVALIFFPLLAVWALGRELWFGHRAAVLGRTLESDADLPEEELTTLPSGRVVRAEADAAFPRYREEVEAAPEDWRAWYRLGLASAGSGARRRARAAIRRAIALERRGRRGIPST